MDRTKSVTLTRNDAERVLSIFRMLIEQRRPIKEVEAICAVAECIQHLLDGHSQITLSENTPR